MYWPEKMERAWKESFVDREFRKVTSENWMRYLQIKKNERKAPLALEPPLQICKYPFFVAIALPIDTNGLFSHFNTFILTFSHS